jgi:hypothetical protein
MEQNMDELLDHLRDVESKLNLASHHLIESKRMILKMEKK